MKTRLVAAVATACLLVGGLTVANAAQLSVTSGSVSTTSASACAETVAVVRSGWEGIVLRRWNRATITLPAGCRGTAVQIGAPAWLGGSATASTLLPAGSGSVTVTLTLSDRVWSWDAVELVVDGWFVPSTLAG